MQIKTKVPLVVSPEMLRFSARFVIKDSLINYIEIPLNKYLNLLPEENSTFKMTAIYISRVMFFEFSQYSYICMPTELTTKLIPY